MNRYNLAGNITWQREHYDATFGGFPISTERYVSEFDPFAFDTQEEADAYHEAYERSQRFIRAEKKAKQLVLKMAIEQAKKNNHYQTCAMFEDWLKHGQLELVGFAKQYLGLIEDISGNFKNAR